MRLQYLEVPNPVNSVYSGEHVIRVVKLRLVLQKSGQIEVVLREHNPHRQYPAAHQPGFLQSFILNLHHLMILHSLADFPQSRQKVLPVMGFHIVILFIGQ